MANKPKMEFPTNVPQTVKIQKMFKVNPPPDDHPEWGESYCYNLIHDGVEKVYFAKDKWHELAQEYPEGSTVVVCFAEETNAATGKKYKTWKMNAALFDEHGKVPQAAPAPIAKNGLPEDEFRKTRKNNYYLALEDALSVMEAFYSEHPKVEPKFEDIRALAVSMVIQFDRKS